jgi:hypothetical protein
MPGCDLRQHVVILATVKTQGMMTGSAQRRASKLKRAEPAGDGDEFIDLEMEGGSTGSSSSAVMEVGRHPIVCVSCSSAISG